MNKQRKLGRFSKYFYNGITYCGVYLAGVVFFLECFLFGIDFFNDTHNVYFEMVTYTVLPVFLILGLVLIPLGALRRRSRFKKGVEGERLKPLRINLGIRTHRNAFFVFLIGTTLFLIMSAVGSYQAFHFTESVHFCGITCHQVMEPEYTRYTQSAHARVKCVECHIGSGADWYVRSKLSGARQVLAMIRKTYSRPITTPVHNLRPAEETCAQCHWPDKFYSSFELQRHYFLTQDPENPEW